MSETWSPEAWVWEQIQAGKLADFNAHFEKTLDPKEPEGWDDHRKLGSDFLRRLFVERRDKIPPEGVRIVGAYLPDGQALAFVRVSQQVWLDQCRCETRIDFSSTTISGVLSLENSFIGKPADSPSVNLGGAHIEGVANFQGTTFKGDVILTGAKIDGHLAMSGSSFEQTVDGNGLQVGQSLFMNEAATFKGDVILISAKIDGQLNMSGSSFEQTVNGIGLQVGQDLFMNEAAFGKPTSLAFARVGVSLDLRGARFASLDLTGSRIAQELRLAGHGLPVSWQEPAFLGLRNVQVGTLQDVRGCWPSSVDLEGFTYGHLGGFGATATDDASDRPIADWEDWLTRSGSSGRYSPRPYVQLASVLIAAGRRDRANAVLFTGREQERKAAYQRGRWWQWLWLTIVAKVCGYGIGSYTFRVLWWILGSAALGTVVLWRCVPAAHDKGLWWCGLASLDRLLPIIQLNKQFADFFANGHCEWVIVSFANAHCENLASWVIVFFACLGLWGWILGLFLIAAVTGIIQRT
jgi:hypothetical protein